MRVILCRSFCTYYRVPSQADMTGCVVQLRWKGKKYAQATWLRLKGRKREDSLVVVSAYLRPVSTTRKQADWQSDLAALSQDILHWQDKKMTVVVLGDFNARIGRQGTEGHMPSPVPQFGEVTKDAQGASLVEKLSKCSLFSLANRAGPEPEYTCHHTQGMSIVDYMLGPAGFLKYSSSVRH